MDEKLSQNYLSCGLQIVVETFRHSTYEPTNQDSMQVLKVGGESVIKKILGTLVIKSPRTSPSLQNVLKYAWITQN